jgi:hypothetical protein
LAAQFGFRLLSCRRSPELPGGVLVAPGVGVQ